MALIVLAFFFLPFQMAALRFSHDRNDGVDNHLRIICRYYVIHHKVNVAEKQKEEEEEKTCMLEKLIILMVRNIV
jgi:hypothetical protein